MKDNIVLRTKEWYQGRDGRKKTEVCGPLIYPQECYRDRQH